MKRIRRCFMIMIAVFLMLAACSKDEQVNEGQQAQPGTDTTNEAAESPATTSPPDHLSEEAGASENETEGVHNGEDAADANAEMTIEDHSFTLERLFESLAFEQPVGMAMHPADPDSIYIVEKPGRIVRVGLHAAEPTKEVFLDITNRVHSIGMEQGLLGVAFHPNVEEHPYFYVNYTTSTHTVIARFADPYGDHASEVDSFQPADSSTALEILTYRQPYTNHNGGDLKFGPDGYLYISSGDGGSGGDPQGHAQNLQSLLGKLLRIDVSQESDGRPYAIPEDNPFADRTIQEEARPEIYAYGLRNPWRFSFDDVTGMLWAADVGQDEIEEINIIENGGNYGWNVKEGSVCYLSNNCEDDALIDPIYEYDHSLGASITGGYVYRGEQFPGLQGHYVYGDFMTGRIWALTYDGQGETVNTELMDTNLAIASFGIDSDEELYILTLDGQVYKLTGQ